MQFKVGGRIRVKDIYCGISGVITEIISNAYYRTILVDVFFWILA